jgi:hypothetical protein
LISGIERRRVCLDDRQLPPALAAEGDNHVSASLPDGVNLVSVIILVHPGAAVPGRLFVVIRIGTAALLSSDDKGQRIVLETAGVGASSEFEAVTRA